MKYLATNVMTLQQGHVAMQENHSSIQNLEKQIGQLTTSIGRLEAQTSGRLPSHALNPKNECKQLN